MQLCPFLNGDINKKYTHVLNSKVIKTDITGKMTRGTGNQMKLSPSRERV